MKILNVLLLSFLFISPAFSSQNEAPRVRYEKAIQKAKLINKNRITIPLFPINSKNTDLKVRCAPEWGCQGGTNNWEINGVFKKGIRIKVVTFIGARQQEAFNNYLKNGKLYSDPQRDIFVTLYPELKKFCTGFDGSEKSRVRIIQYLGLYPEIKKDRFLNIWVKPEDLFRPCRDPQIHDSNCQANWPQNVNNNHKTWLKNYKKNAHTPGPNSFPFTMMGYTYDWAPKKMNRKGVSEYVIRKSAELYFGNIISIDKYCRTKEKEIY